MVTKESFEKLIEDRWLDKLWPALSSSVMKGTYRQLRHQKMKGYNIFPEYKDTFNAFKHTPWDDVTVVILEKGTKPVYMPWAEQGVLMLNDSLTSWLGRPGSHDYLWSMFTKHTLQELSKWKTGVIYVLGPNLQEYLPYINKETNHVMVLREPLDKSCFSTINNILVEMNGKDAQIKWL